MPGNDDFIPTLGHPDLNLMIEEIENLEIGPSVVPLYAPTINFAVPDCELRMSGDGMVWIRPGEDDLNVTEEVVALRKEVEELKARITASFKVDQIHPEDYVLIVPVESEEDKFDNAMKGLK